MKRLLPTYASYIKSFINIADPAISEKVDTALSEGKLWPDPLLQFNPAYEQAGSVKQIAQTGLLHHAMPNMFKGHYLYRYQLEAIRLGVEGKDFVVTSGAGSGNPSRTSDPFFIGSSPNPRPKAFRQLSSTR